MFDYINNQKGRLSFKAGILTLALVLLFSSFGYWIFTKTEIFEHEVPQGISLPQKYSEPVVVRVFDNIFNISPTDAHSVDVEQLSDSQFVYKGAYEKTDVYQTVGPNKLKEDIYLKEPGHPESFKFSFDNKTFAATIMKSGDIYFENKYTRFSPTKVRFIIPAPFMIDATGQKSDTEDVEVIIKEDVVTIIPSKDWLASHKYPVIIDPTIKSKVFDEDISARKEKVKVYREKGGNSSIVEIGGAFHYKDENGRWQNLDNTIIKHSDDKEFDLSNTSNNFKTYFSRNTKNNIVKYSVGGRTVKFKLEDLEGLGNVNNTKPKETENEIIYEGVYDGVDLKYTISPEKLLEELIINNVDTANKALVTKQKMTIENVYYVENEDGSVTFFDSFTNKPVWQFPKPVMYEVNERSIDEDEYYHRLEKGWPLTDHAHNYGLHYEITQDGSDYYIKKVLDADGIDWINDSFREYPIVIDATIDIGDYSGADVNFATKDTYAYVYGADHLGAYIKIGNTGTASRFYRAWFKFDITPLHDLADSSTDLTAASINLYAYGTGSSTDYPREYYGYPVLQDWFDEDLTYNNYASGSSWNSVNGGANASGVDGDVVGDFDGSYDRGYTMQFYERLNSSGDASGWKSYSDSGILNQVQFWFDNPKYNYGWMMKVDDENRINDRLFYYSSDEPNSALRPYLSITYTAGTASDWWDTDYMYRKKITIDNTDQSTTLYNFPALATSTSADTSFWSHVKDDASDLRFVDKNHNNELFFELEKWNSTTNDMVAWVKIPEVEVTSADYFWMYYGNSGASTSTMLSAEDVWDTGYVFVWHMNDASGNLQDSTRFNTDSSSQLGITYSQTGIAGDGVSLSRGYNASHITRSDIATLQLYPSAIEMWVYITTWYSVGGNNYLYIAPHEEYRFSDGSGAYVFEWEDNPQDVWALGYWRPTGSLSTGQWYQIVTEHKDGTNMQKIYKDGSLFAQVSNNNDTTITWGGSYEWNKTWSSAVKYDEFRMSNEVRDPDWYALEYCNMTGSCMTYGAEEAQGPIIESVSDTPDPVDVGSAITFSVDWDNATTVKIKVCKTNSITNQNCDGGYWASSTSFTASDPTTVQYTAQSGDAGGNTFYLVACDSANSKCTQVPYEGVFAVGPPGLKVNSGVMKINSGVIKINYIDRPRIAYLKEEEIEFI